MEELWAWADKFELSVEELPREVNALLALTELTLIEKYITEAPESIGNLKNLKVLTISRESGPVTGTNSPLMKFCKVWTTVFNLFSSMWKAVYAPHMRQLRPRSYPNRIAICTTSPYSRSAFV